MLLVVLSGLTACASSFFKITPENGSAPPASKPAEQPVAKPVEKAPPQANPVAQPQPKRAEPATQTVAPKTAAATPPVAPPIARRPEPVVEPVAIEPTPAGSDSAGIARLMHAAALWDAVRLFHPGTAANTDHWNTTTVRRLTDIRTARSRPEYLATLQQWMTSLADPVSNVQAVAAESDDTRSHTASTAPIAIVQTQVVASGTRRARVTDTTLIVAWPSTLTSVDTEGWVSLRSALTNSADANQIVIDLRGKSYTHSRIESDSALRAVQHDVASLLTSMTLMGPSIRTRAYNGWADERATESRSGSPMSGSTASSFGALWHTTDPLVVVQGKATPQPRRVVFVADASYRNGASAHGIGFKQTSHTGERSAAERTDCWCPSSTSRWATECRQRCARAS